MKRSAQTSVACREHIWSPEGDQQHHVRGPGTHAAQCSEAITDRDVIEVVKLVQIESMRAQSLADPHP